MVTLKFSIGDQVTRLSDVFDPESKRLYGHITKIYNKQSKFGYYPELYQVLWSDGLEQDGFLPHGLELVNVVNGSK